MRSRKRSRNIPYGDNTIVGERGVLLSGGQKARISLARAVYKDTGIYLLDDPLSAVDPHVGNQLFEGCIRRFLKQKCVILVTHQLQYLGKVDKVVVMEKGKVVGEGSYETLHQQGHFGNLLLNKEEPIEERAAISANDRKYEEVEEIESKEQMVHGKIQPKVYKAYIDAGGGIRWIAAVIMCFVALQVNFRSVDFFATFW